MSSLASKRRGEFICRRRSNGRKARSTQGFRGFWKPEKVEGIHVVRRVLGVGVYCGLGVSLVISGMESKISDLNLAKKLDALGL